MSYTEKTTISWGSRLGASFKGVVTGLVVFVAGIALLWWNEGRAVKATRTNAEGAASVVEALPGSVDPAQEGMLVHLSGEATTAETLVDEAYGVSENAIALERVTEMYQWVEDSDTRDEKKLGGKVERTTVYSYRKEWRSGAVDSDSFKEPGHVNPPERVKLGSVEQFAREVKVGVRTLNEDQIRSVGGAVPLKVKYQPVGTNEFFDVEVVPEPKVGDVRVSFSVVRPHPVTVVAAQLGGTFVPYRAKSTGSSISMVADGVRSAQELFDAAERGNRFITWLLRLVGFLMLYGGVKAVLAPLRTLADVVPFIGSIVGVGVGLVAFAVAFPVALVVVALAWLAARPVLAAVLLAAAAAVAAFVFVRRRKAAAGA